MIGLGRIEGEIKLKWEDDVEDEDEAWRGDERPREGRTQREKS